MHLHFVMSVELMCVQNEAKFQLSYRSVYLRVNTGLPHFSVLYFIALCSYCVLSQIEGLWEPYIGHVCQRPFSKVSILLTLWLCHVLVILTAFHTFSLLRLL